jgi:hypothetical protein
VQTYAFARVSGAGPIGDLGQEPILGSGTVPIFDAFQRVLFRSEGDVPDGTYSYRALAEEDRRDLGGIKVGKGSAITLTPGNRRFPDPRPIWGPEAVAEISQGMDASSKRGSAAVRPKPKRSSPTPTRPTGLSPSLVRGAEGGLSTLEDEAIVEEAGDREDAKNAVGRAVDDKTTALLSLSPMRQNDHRDPGRVDEVAGFEIDQGQLAIRAGDRILELSGHCQIQLALDADLAVGAVLALGLTNPEPGRRLLR